MCGIIKTININNTNLDRLWNTKVKSLKPWKNTSHTKQHTCTITLKTYRNIYSYYIIQQFNGHDFKSSPFIILSCAEWVQNKKKAYYYVSKEYKHIVGWKGWYQTVQSFTKLVKHLRLCCALIVGNFVWKQNMNLNLHNARNSSVNFI